MTGTEFPDETLRCVMLNNPSHVAHHLIAAWLNAGAVPGYSLSKANVIELWEDWLYDNGLRDEIRAFLDNTWGEINPPTV
jgi:hypothetical protein